MNPEISVVIPMRNEAPNVEELYAELTSTLEAFGRRYEVACHFCHDGFPKLNTMGQRFKERGFRLENEDPFKSSAWIRSV